MQRITALLLVSLLIIGSAGSALACNPYKSRCGPFNIEPVITDLHQGK